MDPISWEFSRNMSEFILSHNCSILMTHSKDHKLYTLCFGKNGLYFITTYNYINPKCVLSNGKKLWLESQGNIFRLQNCGVETENDITYTGNFIPQSIYLSSDCGVVDMDGDGDNLYFVSSMFNFVCKPSMDKTLNVVWRAPDVVKELTGVCVINGKPKYVTYSIAHVGVVYDIENDEVVCTNLNGPACPRFYDDTLWLLETNTGLFGYIEDGEFIEAYQIPGRPTNLNFFQKYAIISYKNTTENDTIINERMEKTNTPITAGVRVVVIEDKTNCYMRDYFCYREIKKDMDLDFRAVILPNTFQTRVFDIGTAAQRNKFYL